MVGQTIFFTAVTHYSQPGPKITDFGTETIITNRKNQPRHVGRTKILSVYMQQKVMFLPEPSFLAAEECFSTTLLLNFPF
jgi:hypothetical protein